MSVRADITIQQGATFEQEVQVIDASGTAIDLTGFLGRGVIRDAIGGTLIATFTVTISDAANGKVTFSLTPTTTESLSWTGWHVYDVEVYSGSAVVYRVAEGRAELSLEVTT